MKADRHRRFGDLADDIAARLPDHEGLVFGASRYTFREIADRIDEAARRLIAAGVRRGEHVALWLNNSDDWIFISFAVLKIGAVLVPINTRFRSRDLSYVLGQSDTCFLITHDRSGPVDYAGIVREALQLPATGDTVRDPRYPLLRHVILLGQSPQAGAIDWASLAELARHISADHLAVNTMTGRAVYSGHARLWQGDSLVQSDTVELDRDAQTLTATGRVHAIFPQASRTASAGAVAAQRAPGKPDLVRAEAGRMTYDGAAHRARLDEGATARASQGSIRSTSMDLFFVPETGKTKPVAASQTGSPLTAIGGLSLDRATALGDVVIDEDDRHAKAARADYSAAEGKFVLSGGTPTVYDGTGNVTTGRQLTFVFADDRIVVDSEEGSRTLTLHRVEK